MNPYDPTQEALLQAWMDMSVFIRGNRILKEFSFNEIMICGLLFRQQESGGEALTAGELCAHTNLLKSQINHILTGLENGGFIRRVRSERDRRVVYIHLTEDGRSTYLREHRQVMHIISVVFDALGSDKAKDLTSLMTQATAVVNALQKGDH